MNTIINSKKLKSIFSFLALFTTLFLIFRNSKKFSDTKETKDNEAKEILEQDSTISIDARKNLRQVAQSVAHNLGTAYRKIDPRHWTENDQKVFDSLVILTKKEFEIVKDLYFKVYAKGNDLSGDLLRLLDTELYKKLPNK